MLRILTTLAAVTLLVACTDSHQYDLVIRNGLIHDGSGSIPYQGDIAIDGDTIAAMGSQNGFQGRVEIDVGGLAVAPGFINMLSWATETLIEDGRSQSNIRQGVTLEIFGEGSSMGPLSESMKKQMREQQGDIQYELSWTTLGEYLEHLVERGVSPNVASFVGATTIRIHVLGYENRAPTAEELDRMLNPGRHGSIQPGSPGCVGVHIGCDMDSRSPGGFHFFHHGLQLVPILSAGCLQMVNLSPKTGIASYVEQLIQSFNQSIAFTAEMGNVHAIILGHDFRHAEIA